ncbi:MAG: Ig-like domain-containing protein, partial [Saprospiraceae bacterium]
MNPGRLNILLAACSLLAAISLSGQHRVVGGFEKVTGTQTLQWPTFSVSGNGHFVNTGRVNFTRVVTLTNDGGISELSNGQQQAFYGNPCNTSSGTSGLNVFGNEVPQTTINGSAPLRMYSVLLDRTIQLENEWQVVGPFHFYSGRVNTNRSNPGHFLHVLQGGSITGTSTSIHINGYAAYTGTGPFTLPIGDGQKLGQIQITGNCQGPVKAAYFSSNPNTAVLPAGAPFTTSARDSGVAVVSSREYWDVDGVAPTQITLYFDSTSQLSGIASSLSQIVITGWNGSKWVNLGNAASTGTLAGGSVTSGMLVPDLYQAYTFASTCSVVLSSGPGSDNQTLCFSAALAPIEFTTTGANGISGDGVPGANGLPDGVKAVWEGNKIIITGTPLQTGTFLFNIPLLGCSGLTASGTIIVLPAPDAVLTVLADTTVLTCTRPAISLRASGGTSYLWNNNLGTGDSVSVSAPGTYTVRVTAENGCRDSAQVAITEDKVVPVGTLSGVSAICAGDSAVFAATVPGGSWSSSDTAIAVVNAMGRITGKNPGQATITYTVAGVGVCPAATVSRAITVRALPSPGTLSGNQGICVGSVSFFTSSVAGGTWSSSNNIVASVHPTTGVVSGLSAGSAEIRYSVTGADSCTAFITRTVTVTDPPLAGLISGNSDICVGSSTVFSSSGTDGSWSSTNPAVAAVDSLGNVTGLTAGTAIIVYTVKGSGGCTDVNAGRSVTVSELPVPVTSFFPGGDSVLTCARPSLTLIASGGASYNWSHGLGQKDTVQVTQAGTYSVTVTSVAGCSRQASITISQDTVRPIAGITNLTGDSILTCTRTSILLRATGGSSYLWNTGAATDSLLVTSGGTYTVTVTGANGCTKTADIVITQDTVAPQAAIANLTGSNVLPCTRTAISLRATGGTSYLWNTEANSDSIGVTAPGTYTVTV